MQCIQVSGFLSRVRNNCLEILGLKQKPRQNIDIVCSKPHYPVASFIDGFQLTPSRAPHLISSKGLLSTSLDTPKMSKSPTIYPSHTGKY